MSEPDQNASEARATSTIISFAASSGDKPKVTITSHDDEPAPNVVEEKQESNQEQSTGESSIESPVKTRNESVIRWVLDHSNKTASDATTTTTTTSTPAKESEPKRSLATNVITTAPPASTSFLHTPSNKAQPANPFLRTSSFSSSNLNSDDNENDHSSTVIFAAPKLMPSLSSQSTFESSFLRPSVLRVGDSINSTDSTKPKESVATVPTFMSLNKNDIGKIKTPLFIKNSFESSSSTLNGFSSFSSSSQSAQTSTNGGGVRSSQLDSSNSKPQFLFGEKLSERVVLSETETSPMKKDLRNETGASRNEILLSFSDVTSVSTPAVDNLDAKTTLSGDDSSNIGDEESANNQFKRKYEVITGEEDEQNVLSIYGKLYSWDNQKITWVEKGRGQLRLNDVKKNDKLCSRLVMRTTGALRVILNAHIVAGMKFELSSDDCLRFTNVDGIYLIKANVKDIEQLNSAIEHRLREITKRVKTSPDNSGGDIEEENV